MKQKIVIMVSMPCDKCRAKAMELAAKTNGVISIGITGDFADRLEVVGDGVDLVCLVRCLRKKVGQAMVLRVEEAKGDKKPLVKDSYAVSHPLPQFYPGCDYCPPAPQVAVYCEPSTCSVM